MANNTSQTSTTNQQVIALVQNEVKVQKESRLEHQEHNLSHREGETIRSNAWGYKEWRDS